MKRTISLIAILVLSLSLFSGCKKPPTQELAVEAVYPKASSFTQQVPNEDAPTGFYKKVTPVLISDSDENSVSSPFGLYIALSMLSECTEGESRQQILELLGCDVAYKNTKKAYEFFKSVNTNDTKLATSLWIGEECDPLPSLKETLSTKLMTSMYDADFTTDDAKKRISKWINDNTGNLIKDAVANLEFAPNTFMAIVSTLHFDSEWSTAFDKEKTQPDTFFAKSGEVTADFMNECNKGDMLYTFSDSTAVTKRFKNGCEMALILPNEDKTPADVINSGEFYKILNRSGDHSSYDINLSVPKFDIMSEIDFLDDIKSLGVTDIFDETRSDFSPLGVKGGYINKMQQMNRITIDEDRVKAVSGTVISGTYKGEAPDYEEIDFKLNRPFVFMIISGGVPLFVGTVNNPTK